MWKCLLFIHLKLSSGPVWQADNIALLQEDDSTDFKPNKQDLHSELLSGLQDGKVTIPQNSHMFRRQILIGQSLSQPLKQQSTKNTFWGRCGGICVMSQNHDQFWNKLNTNGLDKSKIQYLKKYKPQVFAIFSILVSAILDVVVNCSSVLGLAKCLSLSLQHVVHVLD